MKFEEIKKVELNDTILEENSKNKLNSLLLFFIGILLINSPILLTILALKRSIDDYYALIISYVLQITGYIFIGVVLKKRYKELSKKIILIPVIYGIFLMGVNITHSEMIKIITSYGNVFYIECVIYISYFLKKLSLVILILFLINIIKTKYNIYIDNYKKILIAFLIIIPFFLKAGIRVIVINFYSIKDYMIWEYKFTFLITVITSLLLIYIIFLMISEEKIKNSLYLFLINYTLINLTLSTFWISELGKEKEAIIFCIVSLFCVIFSLIVQHGFICDIWSAIQNKDIKYSPKKAALLLLVPIYNIYWQYKVFMEFVFEYNKYIGKSKISNSIYIRSYFFNLITILLVTLSAFKVLEIKEIILVFMVLVGYSLFNAKIIYSLNAIKRIDNPLK